MNGSNSSKLILGKSVPNATGPYGLSAENPICAGDIFAAERVYNRILFNGKPVRESALLQEYRESEFLGIRSRVYCHDAPSGIPDIFITAEFHSNVCMSQAPDQKGFKMMMAFQESRLSEAPFGSEVPSVLHSFFDVVETHVFNALIPLAAVDLYLNAKPIFGKVFSMSGSRYTDILAVPANASVIRCNQIRLAIFALWFLSLFVSTKSSSWPKTIKLLSGWSFILIGSYQYWVQSTAGIVVQDWTVPETWPLAAMSIVAGLSVLIQGLDNSVSTRP